MSGTAEPATASSLICFERLFTWADSICTLNIIFKQTDNNTLMCLVYCCYGVVMFDV